MDEKKVLIRSSANGLEIVVEDNEYKSSHSVPMDDVKLTFKAMILRKMSPTQAHKAVLDKFVKQAVDTHDFSKKQAIATTVLDAHNLPLELGRFYIGTLQ